MPDPLHRSRYCAAVVLAAVILSGCATSTTASVPDAPISPQELSSGIVTKKLYDQWERWRGTGYRLGGLGQKGIDCSGLTYVVYRDLFSARLPRTTEEQVEVGHSVKRRALEPGDLVFFKTGIFQRHVGIYVEDGKFLHASRNSGVRLSSLDSDYWGKRYWKARRVPDVRAEFPSGLQATVGNVAL